MLPVSREQLNLLRGKQETGEEINTKKLFHIIDPIYHMVIFTARNGIAKFYSYKIGYITDKDLEIVTKRLRTLFPDCIVRSTEAQDYECGGSSPIMASSIVVDWS